MVIIIYLLYYHAAILIPFQIIDQVLDEKLNVSLYIAVVHALKMSCCRGNRKNANNKQETFSLLS